MTKAREMLGLHKAGLEQLLAALHAGDPNRELYVRVGDLMRETDAMLRLAAQADAPEDDVQPTTSQSVTMPMKWFQPAELPQSPAVTQHIAWLKQYVDGMNESNWKDMRLRAERQLESLSAALADTRPLHHPKGE